LLRAAATSEERAIAALRGLIEELRVTMFAVGARTVGHLTPSMLFELDGPILPAEE
jgi:isopentenyl diphosphate isomerase/L-lactate dehydrogenase-like FMN-dependent dehydrogenase